MITVGIPDPSWSATIFKREAVLWVGPGFPTFSSAERLADSIAELLHHPWAAVFLDCPGLPWEALAKEHRELGNLEYRFYDREAGPEQIAANKLPVYNLRGPTGTVGPRDTSDIQAYIARLAMLKRAPANKLLFAIGAEDVDGAGLAEATEANPAAFSQFVLVGQKEPTAPFGATASRLFLWTADWGAFRILLKEVQALAGPENGLRIQINLSGNEPRLIDFSSCVQPDHPITATFDLVPASQLTTDRRASREDLETFLASPEASWFPYASGIPFPRYTPYEVSLKKSIKRIARWGASLTSTFWLTAEDGSGATTLLRHLCFRLASEGHPVLIARPDAANFDFGQLEAFLRSASDRIAAEGAVSPPWVIAFDVQHTERHHAFLSGLASGLRKRERAVAVVAVCRAERGSSQEPYRVLGSSEVIRPALSNSLPLEDAEALGRHLNQFLPPGIARGDGEWRKFLSDTVRTTTEGSRSLFWVALRFWLMRVPGAEHPVRQWLSEKLEAVVAGKPATYIGLMETAVLASHRLAAPSTLLLPDSRDALWAVTRDPANALGLRLVRS